MDHDQPAPSPSVQPEAAQALKELAAAIEANQPPAIDQIRAVLASFKAAGMDRQVQQMVIEVRTDAKAGRIPEALLLRMVARALAGEVDAVRGRGRPPGARNKPKPKEPWEIEAEDATAITGEALDAAEALESRSVKVIHPELPEGVTIAAVPELNEGMNRAVGKLHATVPVPVPTAAPAKNGKKAAPVVLDLDDEIDDELEEIALSPFELVAQAADVIEHLDMPAHAELVGALYELAESLEKNPQPDHSALPLLERAEAEIERRVERAIDSSGSLPLWVIEWARRERDRRDD